MSNREQFEQWCKTVMSDDADFCMEYGAYKNLNVRIRWEAWHAAAKSMQSAVLQQKLTESDRYGRQADITIENLERKVEQLAAENAALKSSVAEVRRQAFNARRNSHNCGPFQYSDLCDSIIDETKVETPATDAILAEVRASGVEMFGKWLRDSADIFDKNSRHDWADQNRVHADKAAEFAAQLRQEAK